MRNDKDLYLTHTLTSWYTQTHTVLSEMINKRYLNEVKWIYLSIWIRDCLLSCRSGVFVLAGSARWLSHLGGSPIVGVVRDTPVRAREPRPLRLHWEIMPIHSRRVYCGKSALHNSGCVFSPYLGIFVGSFNPKEFKEFWMSSRARSIYIRLYPVLQAPIRYWPHNIMNIMRKWQK